MIGYLSGKLLNKQEDRILLLVNQIGYEILLPSIVMQTLTAKSSGDDVALYIYYHQTEKTPKPVLIGFNQEDEKAFFLHFISVEDIGPLKAVKAMDLPISEIAAAIENPRSTTRTATVWCAAIWKPASGMRENAGFSTKNSGRFWITGFHHTNWRKNFLKCE